MLCNSIANKSYKNNIVNTLVCFVSNKLKMDVDIEII